MLYNPNRIEAAVLREDKKTMSATTLPLPVATASPRTRLAGGLYVPCITTFDEREAVDLDAFRSIVRHLVDGGIDGLVVCGTTGEAHALDPLERQALWEAAVKETRGRVPVVAGAGATTTRQARRLIALAAECGCDAALVLTPWFERTGTESLARYFEDLAQHSPLPLLLYHNPSRTQVDLPVEMIHALAQRHPGQIVGLKDSSNDAVRMRAIRAGVPQGFLIFSGGAHQRAAFRAAGVDGCVDTAANLGPREAAETFAGRPDRSAHWSGVSACLEASSNSIGLLKLAMSKLGLPAGKPRRPHDAPPADVEWEGLRLAVSRGGRLVAGEAGRQTELAQTGSSRRISLLAPGLVENALRAQPVSSWVTTVFRPQASAWQYACHQGITRFEERFFAAWSSGRINEDSPEQSVHWTCSADGHGWMEPRMATPATSGMLRWTCAGFWPREGTLGLLAVRFTRARYVEGEDRPGTCWEELATDYLEWDGRDWQPRGLLLDDIYVNEAPRRLPSGEWMMTGVNHRHDAVLAIGGRERPDAWRVVTVAPRSEGFKLTEPSWFVAQDGTIRVLLRDDGGSRLLWLSESRDGGRTFSTPQPTNFTDACAKFFALELSDGRIAVVGNPDGGELRRRFLAVSLSSDGRTFTSVRKLALDPDSIPRLKGMHKASGFSYPNAVLAEGKLWIIVAANKEDILVYAVDEKDL